jgi:hypothetical protein
MSILVIYLCVVVFFLAFSILTFLKRKWTLFLLTSVVNSQLVGEIFGRMYGDIYEIVTEVLILVGASAIFVWGRYRDG